LKRLGVRRVLSVSAVGSLQAEIEPRHAVVPDQLIDRTTARASTFFGEGLVAHISLGDPFCPALARAVGDASELEGPPTHRGGALVVIEGPAFSTRAESQLYRSWGAAVIGMTALPEAKLAREAELCYASICYVTDYDVWHENEADVSVELVIANLQANVEAGRATVARVIEGFVDEGACGCGDALAGALMTTPGLVPLETRRRFEAIAGRYLPAADLGVTDRNTRP
jgi:5'-methylthioadenosine phosphorylase